MDIFHAWIFVMLFPFLLFLLMVRFLVGRRIWRRIRSAREENVIKENFKRLALVNKDPKTLTDSVNCRVQVDHEQQTPIARNQTISTHISTTTTGTGEGELVPRTMSRDLRIDVERGPIGHGRYGHVWSASWNEEKVAVKSFFSMHESAWARETDIYQTCMLQHENILGFIASDIKVDGDAVSMLLITNYHPLGSLHDFLRSNCILTKENLFKFVYSICNGLNHLHTEIVSTSYKPVIVHRDIKSKNILVKSNLDCCISDFDLAVRFNSRLGVFDRGGIKKQEGSVRYMAPECLDEAINTGSIDELKRADIYSFALVIWEIVNRYGPHAAPCYEPPYGQHVSENPGIGDMRRVVCESKIRPSLPYESTGLLQEAENLVRLISKIVFIQ